MKSIFRKITIIIFLVTAFFGPTSFFIQKEEISNANNLTLSQYLKKDYIITSNIVYAQGGNEKLAAAQSVGKSGFAQCDWNEIACHGVNFLYIIFVSVGNLVVGLSAFIMETFLFHSLQSSSYSDSGFIEAGWEILRDLTNIVFIFALLLIAFNLVLGRDESNNKGRLMKTIIIAIVVNFSLFMTYAIIDASNILAYTFYNKIEQNDIDFNASSIKNADGDTDIQVLEGKSASLGIAAKINPQKIFDNQSNLTEGQRALLVIMVGVINGALIYVFLSVSFLFLGRTIGLWLSAVLAPLAFASITIPALQDMKYIGFKNWFNSVLKMAFMAPVFLFFLYLAIQFMNIATISIVGTGGENSTFITSILQAIVPMAAIVLLILTAKKAANSMAGDFAGTISGVVTKGALAVGGLALAAGTGGAALAGRATLGKAAANISKTGKTSFGIGKYRTREFDFKKMTAGNPRLQKRLFKATDKMQNASFDIGKTGVGKFAGKTAGSAGMNMSQPSWAKIGGSGKGGYKKYQKEKEKETREFKSFVENGLSDDKKEKKEKEKIIERNNFDREKITKNIKEIKENKEKWSESIKEAKLKAETEKLKKHDSTKGVENIQLNSAIAKLEKTIREKEDNVKNIIDNPTNDKQNRGKLYAKGADSALIAGSIGAIVGGPVGAVLAGSIAAGVSSVVRNVKIKETSKTMQNLKPEKEPSAKDIMEQLKKNAEKE